MLWGRFLATGLGLAVALGAMACSARAQAPRPLTYVAIGASDAVGVGARDPETEGWVPRFGARLGSKVRVINLGVSGSTLGQALDEQVGPALDAQPDVVTVWLAVNDLNARVPLDQYAAQLDTLLTQLDGTHARVLVGNVPDLGRLAAYRGIDPTPLQAEVDRWNQVIADTTARHGATLVDLYARWQEVAEHPEYLSADGFHPSSEGYQALAEVFGEAVGAGA
jgi:lysophospholipase L1-like esterase